MRLNFPVKFPIDKNVSLKEFTRIKIGGNADYLSIAKSQQDLIELVQFCIKNKYPYLVLGRGSNVFFSDLGFRGLVIIADFGNIEYTSENMIRVGAGAELKTLNELCIEKSLTGFEFSTGIPGTVGGAIFGNAGAYGKSVGECISSARVLTADGKIKWVEPNYFRFRYRHSLLKENRAILLGAQFKFDKGDSALIREKVEQISRIRMEKLPPENILCAGSYFKNLKDEKQNPLPAALLLDAVGSKTISVGGAGIYEKHANIIINKGNATAKDVLKLENILKKLVFDEFNIQLEREVIFIDENGIP